MRVRRSRNRDTATLVVEPFGDTALTIRAEAPEDEAGSVRMLDRLRYLAERLQAEWPHGMTDVVVSPDRVTLVYDPLERSRVTGADAGDTVGPLLAEVRRIVAACGDRHAIQSERHAVVIEIPVRYGGEDGPDLDDVCAACGIDRLTFIRMHTDAEYRVAATGFVPGFAYLAGLPPALAASRRSTPRARVAAGSVGIGGSLTGVYPLATPGGWQIVGRTDRVLFDPRREPAATLHVGDRVRFVEAAIGGTDGSGRTGVAASHADGIPTHAVHGGRRSAAGWLTILAPGLHTTVQDLGRPGRRGQGVPLGGAVDPAAMKLANMAVGNPEQAAVIECTLLGPTIRFESDATIAFVGGEFDGVPEGSPLRVEAGRTLAIGHARRGCRGYLAVAGGIDVEPVLGSRATYAAASLGGLDGRALAAGDRLPLAAATADVRIGRWRPDPRLCPVPAIAERTTLRIVPESGDRWPEAWQACWRATSRFDRMGLRFDGPPLGARAGRRGRHAADGRSVAVLPGTVQVPPDGMPILLMADAQTIGGYPILGQVIAADLPLAARLRCGDQVRFEPVGVAEAHAALGDHQRALATLRRGLVPYVQRLRAIDLNCDVGEGAPHDMAVMPLVSSVNVACGGHAGDAATIRRTVAIAGWHGVAIGAHPGHDDREGFGRRERAITPDAAADLVAVQVDRVAQIAGEHLRHVKLHGALYHQVGRDEPLARAVVERLARDRPDLILVAGSGSLLVRISRAIGQPVVEEAFLDRGYDDRGGLLPRSAPGGMIADGQAVAAQAKSLARESRVTTVSGRSISLRADTLCVHGDGPDPVSSLLAAREALAVEGIAIAAPFRS